MADLGEGDPAAADPAVAGPAADGPAERGPAAFGRAVAEDQVATIAAAAHVGTAKGPHTTDHTRRETDHERWATGPHMIVRVTPATGPRSNGPDGRATGRHSIANGPPATVRHSIVPAETIGPPQAARGNLIGLRLSARPVNSGLLLIDPAETQARRKSVSAAGNQKDHRATVRGRTARGVMRDRHLTAPAAAAAPAGRTRIVRVDHALMAGVSGPAARAGRHDPTTHGHRGHRTSTLASSSVRVMS